MEIRGVELTGDREVKDAVWRIRGELWTNGWTVGDDGSGALRLYLQRTVPPSWQGEESRASTHLGPPQEQSPAQAGKMQGSLHPRGANILHIQGFCIGLKEK